MLDARAIIGESPTWSEPEQALYWIDVKAPALFRFNEGACDRAGRFWVGVMFDPLDAEGQPGRPGSLHVHTAIGGLRPAPDAAFLHDGMAFSSDETAFFVSHSDQQTI